MQDLLVIDDRQGEGGGQVLRTSLALAHLPERVATREWSVLQRATHWPSSYCTITEVPDSAGPGNAVSVELGFAEVTTICTAFGERGLPAERVAKLAAREVGRYERNDAPVCRHFADQLMLPLALLAGGTYRATELTRHAETIAAIINLFLPGAVELGEAGMVAVKSNG